VGQFIEKTPMFMMWLTLAIVSGCVAIFALIAIFGHLHRKEEAKKKSKNEATVTAASYDGPIAQI